MFGFRTKVNEAHLAIVLSLLLTAILYFSDLMRFRSYAHSTLAKIDYVASADTSNFSEKALYTDNGRIQIGDEGVVWIKLRNEMLSPSYTEEGILSVDRINFDTIQFIHILDGVEVVNHLCGSHFDHSAHLIATPRPAFPIFGSPGEHQVILKISGKPGLNATITYGSTSAMFEKAVRTASRRSSFLIGQLFVAFVILLVSLKTGSIRFSLFLALFAVSSVLTNLILNGYGFPALWPNRFGFSFVLPTLGAITIYALMRLVYHLFQLPEHSPRLARLVDYGFVIPTIVLLPLTILFNSISLVSYIRLLHLSLWFFFMIWLMLYSRRKGCSEWPWLLIVLPFTAVFIIEYMTHLGLVYFPSDFAYEVSAILMIIGLSLMIATHEQGVINEVERQRRWLDLTLHSIRDGVIVMDMERKIRWVNEPIEKLFEMSLDEMKDRRLIELRPWSDEIISLFKSELELALKQKKQGRFFPLTFRFPDLPGPIYFSVSFTPVITKKKEDNQLVLLVRDITERTMIEQRLNHTERMEAMGRLASGIAHDFKNTLNGVAGLATLLEKSADQSDRVSELARDIIEAADSAQNSIQDLLNFAHPRMRSMAPCNLHEVVNSALGLARLTSQIGVTTEKQFLAEEEIVNGDASALQDAILNIIINAKDAMPNGGKITLRTSNIDLSQEECDRSGFRLKPGRYIELVISDAGDGISEEHLSHIFEPFYTTKSDEKGTGLGLPSAYSTVLAHEGGIRVESRLRVGTSFIIHIPLLSTPRDEA